ncbi:GNAT family N-acetyltransferase [Methylovirgula sp. 4M-Z18]|uniref:GNAT family N-acetyltransferase n=1 Tax=Methylovirgula sp. 4M-Z18 TaxID=2293567 RepID=UPI000E2E4705|nr:GNAT family N-acetyltransferase [Methylovirgula sp. 4M-Z18]RFB80182.1 GNAT family N-acetyltransferase [Methylovirgula sp. 4M-Z18]
MTTLRPMLPADGPALAELFRLSIEVLTEEDYDEDQREAWMASADDEAAFGAKLANALTIVAENDGEIAGFASLDQGAITMLYVHPQAARQGVGTVLADALERLGAARGLEAISVDASDTAHDFFKNRGYVPQRRQSLVREDVVLSNTYMIKKLKA